MRTELGAALAVLLASSAVAGHAQVAAAPPPPAAPAAAPAAAAPAAVPAPSDAQVAKALGDAAKRFAAQDCAGVLTALDPIALGLRPDDPRYQPVQRLRLSCLLPAGRGGEIEPLYAKLIQANPRDPALRVLGVAIAMDQHRFPVAAQRLADIAGDQPSALTTVQTDLVKQLREAITVDRAQKPLADRLDLALATAGWQADGEPDLDDAIHASAVQQLVARDDLGQARTQLAQIDAPETLVDLAIERRTAALWPDIAAQLGDHGSLAVDAYAADHLEAFAREPGGDRTLRDAVRSFILLSRPQDAIDLASRVVVADKMSQELVTTVNYQAEALAFLGRREEALARLKQFETIDLRATPAAVNALVLYTELLDEAGHPDQALTVVRTTRDKARAVLSPWGLGWLQRGEACALGTLAQAVPAKAAGDLLVTQADANPAAAIEGLLCLGRRDEAAKIAVRTLAMPEGADMLADQFQPAGALWVAPPSRLRALWAPFLARPDVKTAFNKAARILPKELWPSLQPRPIPRSGTAPAVATSPEWAVPPILSATIERWPVRGAFTIARGAKTFVDVVVATIAVDGLIGRGEGTPIYYHGETAESVLAQVLGIGEAIAAGADRAALAGLLARGAARNAVDAALWSLEAAATGRRIWSLAGLPTPEPLVTAVTISLGHPARMEADARAVADHPLLKLKLAGEGDLARVAAVRRGAPAARLIVDANEAWTGRDVAAEAAALLPFGVELIEQPVRAGEDALLDGVRSPIPLCADESCQDRGDLARCIGRYDAINIKLDKAGGLTEALALVADARAGGMRIMVGCMLATSLGVAPAFLLAQAAEWVDLDGPYLLAEDRADGFAFACGVMTPGRAGQA